VKVSFVVGHEDSSESPGDTPEAYWRTFLPAKTLGQALILGKPGLVEKALSTDVVWIYEPTSYAAVSLAEAARRLNRPVVIDWSEDVYSRTEQDYGYSSARLEAAERAMALADLIVCTSRGLTRVYDDKGPVAVVETVLPAAGWDPSPPDNLLAWWSDGRQKRGFEAVAPALIEVLEATNADLVNVQFAHERPLMRGAVGEQEIKRRAARLFAYFGDGQVGVEENLRRFRAVFSQALVSLECYLPGRYAETVSDVPILRAAALGIPTITTRTAPPPGCVAAGPSTWAEAVLGVMRNQRRRAVLSRQARAWAERRSSYQEYQSVLDRLLA